MADMRSLFDELTTGVADVALLTTYNVHFGYFEHVVLPKLRAGRVRHVIVLADAKMLAQAYADPLSRPQLAGRDYALVGIETAASFHPKIILRLSKNGARALVGSHNLTASGFGHNLEVTTRIAGNDAIVRNTARLLWNFARGWAERSAFGPAVIHEVFAPAERLIAWLADVDPSPAGTANFGPCVAALPDGPSLWQQLEPHFPDDCVRVVATSPYFDDRHAFLGTLARRVPNASIVVAVDPRIANLSPLPSSIPVRAVKVPDAWGTTDEDAGTRRAHAKALWCVSATGQHTLVAGSANASAAAWLAHGTGRNAEVVTLLRGKSALDSAQAMQLEAATSAEPLSQADYAAMAAHVVDDGAQAHSQALVARWEHGTLRVVIPSAPELALVEARVWNVASTTPALALELDRNGNGWQSRPDTFREAPRFVEVEFGDGHVACGPVHDIAAMQRSARTDRELKFDAMLNSLSTTTPDVGGLLSLLDATMRAENDVSETQTHSGPGSSREATGASADAGVGPDSLFVEAERTPERGTGSQRSGPLADILGVLLQKIRVENTVSESATAAASADDDDDSLPDDAAELSAIAVQRVRDPGGLRRHCHAILRRIVTHVRGELIAALKLQAATERDVSNCVVHVAAVLAVMDYLSRAEFQDADENLVDQLIPQEAFDFVANDVVPAFFAASFADKLAGPARDDGDARWWGIRIRALAGRLVLHAGTRLDRITWNAASVPSDASLRMLATLALTFRSLSSDAECQRVAIELYDGAAPAAMKRHPVAWWVDHIRWGRALCALIDRPPTVSMTRAPRAGDVALVRLRSGVVPAVWSHADGRKVCVVRADSLETREGTFLQDRVIVLPMPTR